MLGQPNRIYEIVSDAPDCLPVAQKGLFLLAYSRPSGMPLSCVVTDGDGDMIIRASYPLSEAELYRLSHGGCLSERAALPMPKAHTPCPTYTG